MNVTEKFALRDLRAGEAAVDDEREQRPRRRGSRAIPAARGSANSLRRCCSCSCGRVHIVDSATNETTSTIAAVQLNSHTGIGRSALPTIPCACGARREAPAPRAPRPPSSDGSMRRSGALMPARSLCKRMRCASPVAAALAYPAAACCSAPLAVSDRHLRRPPARAAGDPRPALRAARAHARRGRPPGARLAPGLLLRRASS